MGAFVEHKVTKNPSPKIDTESMRFLYMNITAMAKWGFPIWVFSNLV